MTGYYNTADIGESVTAVGLCRCEDLYVKNIAGHALAIIDH